LQNLLCRKIFKQHFAVMIIIMIFKVIYNKYILLTLLGTYLGIDLHYGRKTGYGCYGPPEGV